MGRKIKGRKHRGVRDPLKQQQERFEKIKFKIDQPPSNPEDQPIPKSLTRLVELKDKVKSGEYFQKKVKKTPDESLVDKNFKLKPVFKKRPNETDRVFVQRVTKECKTVLREAAFEKKYKVTVKYDSKTGEVVKVEKSKPDELEMYLKKVIKEKKKGKKKGKKNAKPTENVVPLTKSQKRLVKLKDRKERLEENRKDEFNDFQDTVGFGEVVHAPPTLVKPRRVKDSDEAPRPGKKNLLLKSIISSKGQMPDDDKFRKVSNKVIDKKGKRKDLPNALRRQLDKQQTEIIEAYRKIKQQKYIRPNK